MNAPDDTRKAIERESARNGRQFPVRLALADYDRTRPIIDGRVRPEGIALTINTAWIGDFCERPVYEEYDVAEMSLSWYVAARCRGEPVVAIPIFPLRMPVLAYLFCRADATYTRPQDLVGRRIGAPGYRYTVNLWVRGILQEHYGVAPEDMQWVTCREEGAGFVIPQGIDVRFAAGRSPEDLLECGEVDAILVPAIPVPFARREPWIRRLFPDARAEMHAYFRSTGIVPITHTVVMNQALYEREPWLAERLLHAFREAQRLCDGFYAADPKHLSLPDAIFALEEQRAAYGSDPYVQGLGPNRQVIETFVRYAHEQGYISRRPALEELFAPITLAL